MSSRFDIIAQQFLQKPFSDCSIAELQQLAEAYPYLAPAQFLLAKKLQGDGAPQARALVQKAALYYHQPALFDAFLASDFDEATLYAEEEAADSLEADVAENFVENDVAENFVAEDAETIAPVAEEMPQPPPPVEMDPAREAEISVPEAPEPPQEAAQIFEEQPMPVAAPETADSLATTDAPGTDDNTPAVPAPVAAPKPVAQTDHLPAFEPFHTVDYFASQGIRLSQEEATKDKMGKQLKSFTEWLKTMKRIPATEQIKVLDPHAEKKVEHLAAHSVAQAEIVTEAMAEVWLKQGALEKAAAVYRKLGLAHPSKKEYFARKLEDLRQTTRNQ